MVTLCRYAPPVFRSKQGWELERWLLTRFAFVFNLRKMMNACVDLAKYPILEPLSLEYQKLVQRSQNELRETGLCVLDGFVRPEALKLMRKQAADAETKAYYSTVNGNAYLRGNDPGAAADHVTNLEDHTTLGVVAYDQISSDDVIRQIYDSPEFLRYIGDATGRTPIYYYDCPMGKVNYSMMRDGDYLRWHFDQSDFVVSIPVVLPESGGVYEYAYNIRSPEDENYDEVKRLLLGDRSRVRLLDTPPGSLVLFEGRYTIHRVTPIEGDTIRVMALLGFADKPGTTSTDYLRKIRYGRV